MFPDAVIETEGPDWLEKEKSHWEGICSRIARHPRGLTGGLPRADLSVPIRANFLEARLERSRFAADAIACSKQAASEIRDVHTNRSQASAMGTLRYSWLLTAFCVLGMIFSPLMCLWLGVRGLSAHVGPKNQTVQVLACYAAAASAAGSGAMPPRITAAVC